MNQQFTYSLTKCFPTEAEIYSFSAKERDTETGLSVTSLRSFSSSSLNQTRTSSVWYSLVRRFGARYYSSDLSIWLSVDPMSDKYPSTSPYTYCRNNPIILVDPNGKFDTRSEARQYRRMHHTGGRILKNSQKDKFAGAFSIDNKRKGISYTKPQYEETDANIVMHGLSSDGVVKSPIAHDPRTRREKFDDFETHATQTGVAICQGLATGLPISSTANDIITLTKGENMFGDKASKSDKAWATIGLATLGTGHLVKGIGKLGAPVCRKAGEIIDYIGYALDVRSGISTTRNKLKNGKKKK